MNTLTSLEKNVLQKLLEGSSEWLGVLREQACTMDVTSRELSGAGFFTQFSVPGEVPRLKDRASFKFGDVSAEVNNLTYGAGFLLTVKDGAIASLEGYSYEEPWPREVHTFRVHYNNNEERNEDLLSKSIIYSK